MVYQYDLPPLYITVLPLLYMQFLTNQKVQRHMVDTCAKYEILDAQGLYCAHRKIVEFRPIRKSRSHLQLKVDNYSQLDLGFTGENTSLTIQAIYSYRYSQRASGRSANQEWNVSSSLIGGYLRAKSPLDEALYQ